MGTATEVRTAAKMPTAMAATTEMRTTMPPAMTAAMTAAVATAAMATTTFGSGKPSGREHCRESNDGNAEIQF